MPDALKRSPVEKIKPTAEGIHVHEHPSASKRAPFSSATRITSSEKLFSVVVVLRIFGIVFFGYRYALQCNGPVQFPEHIPVGLPAYLLSHFLEILHNGRHA